MIREGQLPMELFYRLKVVEFNFFFENFAVFPFDLLHIFHNLETLTVVRGKLKELLPPEELVDDENYRLILTKVRSLKLFALPNLKIIWDKLLQTLDSLLVWECDSLIILTPSFASFQCLTSLDISKCRGLVSLMKSSAAKSQIQLERLTIEKCNKLKVIISDEEDETLDEITFTKLETLELDCLPSLISFCSTGHLFKLLGF